MAKEITLTAAMRANLISLQNTEVLLNRTQERLATGKKVNSALDNPLNYFAAAAHTERANQLITRKDGMGEAIQTIKAANNWHRRHQVLARKPARSGRGGALFDRHISAAGSSQ
jgi:hypothetical protein